METLESLDDVFAAGARVEVALVLGGADVEDAFLAESTSGVNVRAAEFILGDDAEVDLLGWGGVHKSFLGHFILAEFDNILGKSCEVGVDTASRTVRIEVIGSVTPVLPVNFDFIVDTSGSQHLFHDLGTSGHGIENVKTGREGEVTFRAARDQISTALVAV